MKKADLIPIAAVLILAVLISLLFISGKSGSVRIKCDSGTYEYPVNEDRRIELHENGIDLVVEIKDGKVRVAESTCRDLICMHTYSGNIVCLPAHVVITLSDEDYDYVAG